MDLLDHRLKGIKRPCFGALHIHRELRDDILAHDSIRGSEESEYTKDEELFGFCQAIVPLIDVLRQVDLFCGPK